MVSFLADRRANFLTETGGRFPFGYRRVHLAGVENLADAISVIAERQHGLISVEQLTRVASTRARWRRLADEGWLRPVAPKVYVVAGAPTTWHRGLMTGLLSLGPDAVVSHRAAAALHGFDRVRRNAAEFTMPRSGRGRTGPFCVHTSGHLARTDVVTVDGLRVTSATRTLIDLARLRVPRVEIEAAIDSAVRLQLASPVVVERRLADLRGRGRWGCRLLDDLLVDSGGHTMLERRFLRLVREAGLPRPRPQVVMRDRTRTVARVDFVYDDHALVVEVSGQHGHSSPAERSKDAQRRNELQDLGWSVYEYTWDHVTRQGASVVRSLQSRLYVAGWRPTAS